MLDTILDFYFNAKRYKGMADSPVDTRVLDRNIKRIQEKADEISDIGINTKGVDTIDVLKRVAKAFSSGKKPENAGFNRKELKCLSYNIKHDDNSGFVEYCTQLLDYSWSDIYLRGLLHSLLIHWTDYNDAERQRLCDYFKKKTTTSVSHFSDSIKPFLMYIDRGGPYKLGNYLRTNKKTINEACHALGLSDNRISYSYFSDAIIAYYDSINAKEFPEVQQVLKSHNNTRTSKVVVSKLIIQFQDNKSSVKSLMDFSLEMIGDPTLESHWAPFPNATREEEKNLKTARMILLRLYAERTIDTFFKILCTDERRRKFWMRYTKKIDNFIVYGPTESMNALAPYINYNFLTQHYKLVNSTVRTCGLVLYMRDYVIIEFSDTGALYAYKKGERYYNMVFVGSIYKIDSLKLSFLSSLVTTEGDYMYFREEGKLIHSGYWERRLNAWIERYIK